MLEGKRIPGDFAIGDHGLFTVPPGSGVNNGPTSPIRRHITIDLEGRAPSRAIGVDPIDPISRGPVVILTRDISMAGPRMGSIGIRPAGGIIPSDECVIERYPNVLRGSRLDTTMECPDIGIGVDEIANPAGFRNLIAIRRQEGTLLEDPDISGNIQLRAGRGRANTDIALHNKVALGHQIISGDNVSAAPGRGRATRLDGAGCAEISRMRGGYPIIRLAGYPARFLDYANTLPGGTTGAHPFLDLGRIHAQCNRPRNTAATQTGPGGHARDVPAAIGIRLAGHAARRVDNADALPGGAGSGHPFLDLRGIHVQRHRPRTPASRQPAPGGHARDVAAAVGILAARHCAAGVGLELLAGGFAGQLQGIDPRRAAHVQLVAGVRGLADAHVAGFVDHQTLYFGAGLDGQQVAIGMGGGVECPHRVRSIQGQGDIAGDARDDEYLVSEPDAIPHPQFLREPRTDARYIRGTFGYSHIPRQGFGEIAQNREIGLGLVVADAHVAGGVIDAVPGVGLGPQSGGWLGRRACRHRHVIDGHVPAILAADRLAGGGALEANLADALSR